MVFKLLQILDEKNNIYSVSFIMAAETNPRVHPATLLESHIIKELDKLILILKERDKLILILSSSRTRHDSVYYVYFRLEQLISILMRAVFMNLMNQGVLDLVINSWENLKYIINNKELPKTVNFFLHW